jgi:transcriptional regulator with XRE-family HTH domain
MEEKSEFRSEFSARLKKAMQEAGYQARPVVLEREFNLRYWGPRVSVQAVARWLKGEAVPAQDKLQVIAEWLQVEPQALRFGMESVVQSIRNRKKRWAEAISGPEREMLETFLALSPEHKMVARTVIRALALKDRETRDRCRESEKARGAACP